MLESVDAVRFDRRMNSGRTSPCLIVGHREDGQEVELIAKFSECCDRKVDGLVSEALAAILAADLDLFVPEPFLLHFDAGFVDLLPASVRPLSDKMRASVSVAFGSTKLPAGFALLPRDKAITKSLQQQAAEIFAFDGLIINPDRRPENPNCLLDGNSFAIFDHELAFMTQGILGWRPPWERGGLDAMRQHLFFMLLAGQPCDLRRFKGAWATVSDNRLAEYHDALPPQWHAGSKNIDSTLEYIARVRDNIESAIAEIERVLA